MRQLRLATSINNTPAYYNSRAMLATENSLVCEQLTATIVNGRLPSVERTSLVQQDPEGYRRRVRTDFTRGGSTNEPCKTTSYDA